ncbi:MAG: RNA-binding S4 domain-containing protein [Pyrinomonadaceae bacterium]
MRLDLFLKLSRLIPKRTLAQEYAKQGLVSLNGKPAKPSSEVKDGDEIEIRKRSTIRVVKVLEVPSGKQVSKKDSSTLYEQVSLVDLDPLLD